MELGWTYPKRKRMLDDLTKRSSGKTFPINFQGKLQHLDIYSVAIGLPKYRLNNGRTYAAQAEYLSEHPDLPKEYFTADPELEPAIRAQHEVLKKLVPEKNLFDYFKEHGQEEPLILTHEGFILNGNRRLCAMRELLQSDPTSYKRFEHIDVIILPPCDDKDLDELEAKLQIHKDIKADYSWITFALMLKRRQEEHNYDKNRLAELYEIRPADVSELIDMLAYAEDYLDQRNKRGQYHLIEQDKYAFQQIRKKRNTFKTEPEKVLFEKISYALIDNPEGGRLYEMIPDTANYFEKIIETIKDDVDLPEIEHDSATEDTTVDILGGRPQKNLGELSGIISLFDDEEKRKIIREILVDVVTGEKRKEQEKQRKNYVLVQIKKAHSSLTDAVNSITEATSKKGVDEQLIAIEEKLKRIRDWFNG